MGNETLSLAERGHEDEEEEGWLKTTEIVQRRPTGGLRPGPAQPGSARPSSGSASPRSSTFLKSFFIQSIMS